ncbi:MAG: class II fructose-bisphosphate aldolase [Patescibacteria group bacterium]|nr:class II fructose-bisphosphate aldolase [Patescibacteria group bacterium]
MTVVSSKKILEEALRGGYAVGAFNTSTLEATKAIINAAAKLASPVIIETSEGEFNFLDSNIIFDQVKDLSDEYGVTVALHLDHGKSLETVKKAVEARYTSVHIDASNLSYQENIELTQKVAEFAHKKNISVEGELGHISGSSEKHSEKIEINLSNLTDPGLAKEFVKETGIDILAVSIGNIHGVYTNPPELDLGRLERISKVKIPLSLHGGSGIPENQIKMAVKLGIAKVNVNTELRMAYAGELREELKAHPKEIVPYKILPEVIEEIEKVVENKIKLFGSEGKG